MAQEVKHLDLALLELHRLMFKNSVDYVSNEYNKQSCADFCNTRTLIVLMTTFTAQNYTS